MLFVGVLRRFVVCLLLAACYLSCVVCGLLFVVCCRSMCNGVCRCSLLVAVLGARCRLLVCGVVAVRWCCWLDVDTVRCLLAAACCVVIVV